MEMKHIIMLGIVVLLMVIPILFVKGKFEGSDDVGTDMIKKLDPHYKPWFHPIWEPPSGEIESLLYALQAAIGAIIIGYFIGYYKGKAESGQA
ncbi:energy-coupling factor ABC transporter substrate-binding protein [Methanocaldococcus infernus]